MKGSAGSSISAHRCSALIFIEDGSFTFDNRVKREADTLLENGWDVTVISQKYPCDPYFRKMGERLRCYYYRKPTTESTIGHLIEHAVSLVMGSALTMWVAVRHGFTVFHACNPMDILWLIALPYKLLGRKFIFDQHDLCPEIHLSRGRAPGKGIIWRVLTFLERQSFKYANVVISTNESYRHVALTRGKKDSKQVFVVRNGPDLTKFKSIKPGENAQQNHRGTLVGYLGNMNEQDGVDYLLRAMKEINVKCGSHNIRALLIGDGSRQKRLVTMAHDLGLSDNVCFTGRIPDEQMLPLLNSCDICVQPDPINPLNDVSTMNKAMEYMALSKPVIAFDLRETRVSCGDAALYATPNDVGDLAEKILLLAGNAEMRARMGQLGRKRVEDALAWKYSKPHILAAYAHALEVE